MTISNRKPLVIGNWKMNGDISLLSEYAHYEGSKLVDLALCFPFLHAASFLNNKVMKGCQNVSHNLKGAFTGEISTSMLNEFNVECCLVGHSERREYYQENNEIVAQKASALLQAKIIPVICIGEPEQVRKNRQVEMFIASQLEAIFSHCTPLSLRSVVIAYEPIWAIGTGKTATPEEAQKIHKFIRKQVANIDSEAAESMRILYGGSVNQSNAKDLFGMDDIDGGLIGGASLDISSFKRIVEAAENSL